MTLPEIIKSRRFWIAAVALLFVFLGDNTGFDQQQITDAVYLIVSLIISLGVRSPGRA